MAINKQKSTKTFNLNTRRMFGYHRPKHYKQQFVVKHVQTTTVSVITATSLTEAVEIFSAINRVPVNHIVVYSV